jgi:ketosteroid isomerase-like protein
MYRPYSSPFSDPRLTGDVESQIRSQTQDYVTSFNTGNYDLVAGLFAKDGALMITHHEPVYAPSAVERLLRQFGETGYADLRMETLRVDASGDMAMEVGRYSVVIRGANSTTATDRGNYLRVWRRLGVWLISAECWSSNLPVAESRSTAA